MTMRGFFWAGCVAAGAAIGAVAIPQAGAGERPRIQLSKPPVDISYQGFETEAWREAMAEIAEAPDDYLFWADRQYGARLARAPEDARLQAERGSLRVEMRRRGLTPVE